MANHNQNRGANSDLRHLVRATSQLQEQVRSAVQRLEQSTSGSPGSTSREPHGAERPSGSTMRLNDGRCTAVGRYTDSYI